MGAAAGDPEVEGDGVSGRDVEFKTQRDVNVVTNEPVLRIFARYVGDRRWQKFLAVATRTEPIDYLERHAEELARVWLRVGIEAKS